MFQSGRSVVYRHAREIDDVPQIAHARWAYVEFRVQLGSGGVGNTQGVGPLKVLSLGSWVEVRDSIATIEAIETRSGPFRMGSSNHVVFSFDLDSSAAVEALVR